MTSGLNFRQCQHPKEQCSSPFLDDGGVQRPPSSPTPLGRTSTSLLSHPQTRSQSRTERGPQAPLRTQSPGCEMPALHWLPCIEPAPGALRGRLLREGRLQKQSNERVCLSLR